MKPYCPTLGDVAANYPSSIYSPEDIRDPDDSDLIAVSVSQLIEVARYELPRALLPARFPIPVVTVNGSARTVIPFNKNFAPSTGKVAIGFDFPIIEFAAADVGVARTAAVSYSAIGSTPTARVFNQVQKEIAAIETALADPTDSLKPFKVITGIDLAATGTTDLLVVDTDAPAGFIGSHAVLKYTTATAVTVAPSVSLGANSSAYDDAVGNNVLDGFLGTGVADSMFIFRFNGLGRWAWGAGETLKLKRNTAATATAAVATLYLYGTKL